MESVKLDKIDHKILTKILHGFRKPMTKIAKECKVSREQVEYRIKKYEQKGIIAGYLVIFNLSELGFKNNYHVRLRVKDPKLQNLESVEEIKEYMILTRLKCYGEWDYILNVFTKTKKELISLISLLYEKWKSNLLDYDIYELTTTAIFPLKIFGARTDDDAHSFIEKPPAAIDETDKKIMKEIAHNAKIKVTEIANNIGENSQTVSYRLRLLEKSIIRGYRIFLDLEKINYSLAQVAVKMSNLSNANIKKLEEYSKQEKRIHAFSIGIGRLNTMFQIIYQTPKELSEEINKIKEAFSDDIVDYEISNVESELMPRMLPDEF